MDEYPHRNNLALRLVVWYLCKALFMAQLLYLRISKICISDIQIRVLCSRAQQKIVFFQFPLVLRLDPNDCQFAKNNNDTGPILSQILTFTATSYERTLLNSTRNTGQYWFILFGVFACFSRLSSAYDRSDSSSLYFLLCPLHSLIVYYTHELAGVISSTSSMRDLSDILHDEYTPHNRYGNFSSPSSSVSLDSWLDGGVSNWGRPRSRYS